MKTTISSIFLLWMVCSGCKKPYTCTCTNTVESKDVFTQKSNKADAKAKCQDYYDANYGVTALNDTSCEIR